MDKTANWEQVKEIFSSAIELEPDRWRDFVAQKCNGDDELKKEIESWLASYSESEGFIENSLLSAEKIFSNGSPTEGRQFGNYLIIREIGYGGMGAVFLAKRNDGEFEQEVALKIVRQSIAESQMIESFRRERQILASLNHPNIAKLLDGGISASGEPFLVMEYIEGVPLLEFAGDLNIDLRLRLFLKICSAASYAHRNLVVHRDIKPSNILVTKEGQPKLLDFGLAKMLDVSLTDENQTKTALFALTPAYASPEQLCGGPATIAGDIYSLGVVLYELLTHERPFHLEGGSLDEIIRIVAEIDPPPPSSIPRTKRLSRDIDNIAMTALRKEPERRYQSVEAFAVDIERYLDGLPVSARPNTLRYRASKFIRRHKLGVAAASLIILSLVGGIVASLWQANIAKREKAKGEVVNTFLQNMLSYTDNSMTNARPKGKDMTVTDVLNEASRRLETEDLSGQPEVKAELQRIIGASYLSQGQYELAEKNLRPALETITKVYGENSMESLRIIVELGQLFVSTSDFANAEEIYQKRLTILRREQQRGAIDPTYLFVALNDYAVLRRSQGHSGEAEGLLTEALALRPQIPTENRIAVGIVLSVYALTLSDRGEFAAAEDIVRSRIAEIRRQEDPETAELAINLNGLGNFLMEKGEQAESIKCLLEAEKILRKISDPNFISLGDNLRLQAQVLYLRGDLANAEARVNESIEIYRRNSRPQFINFPTALTVQGLILNKTHRVAKAEKILREAVELRKNSLPSEHFLTALTEAALGECLATQRRFADARPLLNSSYESLKRSQGTSNPRTLLVRSKLAAIENGGD